VGPGLAYAAAGLARRDELVESMRARLHGGTVRLNVPDGFVLGDDWLEGLDANTDLSRPGGPLLLDVDLDRVKAADRALRDADSTRALAAALDLMALTVEAHEARHALDEIDPNGPPPPPALFALMGASAHAFIAAADRELRAYLGELHDAPAPACLSLALLLRDVFGRGSRRTPHYYAGQTILGQLNPDPDGDLDGDPLAHLRVLCTLPDAELRRRVAAAWQKLYNAPLPPGRREAPDDVRRPAQAM
jgi:hypothetical protein